MACARPGVAFLPELSGANASTARLELGLASFQTYDDAALALVQIAYRAAPREWTEVGDAEMKALDTYPALTQVPVKANDAYPDLDADTLGTLGLGVAADGTLLTLDIPLGGTSWKDAVDGTPVMSPLGSDGRRPSPAAEETFRKLAADWEGFDYVGVGEAVLPAFRDDAIAWRAMRDAWMTGRLHFAAIGAALARETTRATRVRHALRIGASGYYAEMLGGMEWWLMKDGGRAVHNFGRGGNAQRFAQNAAKSANATGHYAAMLGGMDWWLMQDGRGVKNFGQGGDAQRQAEAAAQAPSSINGEPAPIGKLPKPLAHPPAAVRVGQQGHFTRQTELHATPSPGPATRTAPPGTSFTVKDVRPSWVKVEIPGSAVGAPYPVNGWVSGHAGLSYAGVDGESAVGAAFWAHDRSPRARGHASTPTTAPTGQQPAGTQDWGQIGFNAGQTAGRYYLATKVIQPIGKGSKAYYDGYLKGWRATVPSGTPEPKPPK